MPSIPGVPHRRAVRALVRAGFVVEREGRRHIVMTNGVRTVTIPRHNPINAFTMGGIVVDSGLSVDEFRRLL
jgi:predicted RNA binding protein YcfA (HicA-like mRNA interferase family)